jgi:hypothetical protein
MPEQTKRAASPDLGAWLHRHDWTLYETATNAVEDKEEISGGLRRVKKTQLRAVINTARMCSSPSTFRGFLEKRAERRRAAGQDTRADFWSELASQLDYVQEEHAEPAVDAAGIPDARADGAEMRVVRAYFEHLISHCHVAGE